MNTGNARQIATVEWQTKSLMAGCHQNLVDREVWNSDVLYSLFRWTQTQWIGDQHLAAPGHANSGKPLVVGQFCIGGEALAEWCTRYFTNFHRQFVKGGPPWQCHKVQWRVYMVYLAFSHVLPSAIDNTGVVLHSHSSRTANKEFTPQHHIGYFQHTKSKSKLSTNKASAILIRSSKVC